MTTKDTLLQSFQQFPEFLDKIKREAVLAERERCAKIAEQHGRTETEGYACQCDTEIADAIRSGK